jgi:arginine decarboxylase
VLRELHGFIHMFEDTPEFIARYVMREAKAYLDSLAPPFFRALVHYAADGSYSWHCPGHSGGVAFLKSPVGQMFHQFFGENMLRADVCNAVDELGQLLDHTGPVAASERNAARIFNCDHLFFVTNGTSTSNKMVWHSTVAPGDIVVVDRNCHKSILHSIIMTGAMPVFLTPTRNHYGIIGPIPLEEFSNGEHPREDRGQPVRARGEEQEAAHPDHHAVDLRRHLYNVETIKDVLDGEIDTLHFDEAWLPHAPSTTSTATITRSARPAALQGVDDLFDAVDAQAAGRPVAGLADPGAGLADPQARPRRVQRGLPDAHLDQPQYAIIASCDVAAAMMEPPGGTALVEESLSEALDFRRAMRKVDAEFGADWWFKVWGPERIWPRRASARARTGRCGRRALARLRRPGRRLQHARPDQGHGHHAGPDVDGDFADTPASRRRSSPSTWPSTASSSRRPACTRSSSCSPSASPRAAGTRW